MGRGGLLFTFLSDAPISNVENELGRSGTQGGKRGKEAVVLVIEEGLEARPCLTGWRGGAHTRHDEEITLSELGGLVELEVGKEKAFNTTEWLGIW